MNRVALFASAFLFLATPAWSLSPPVTLSGIGSTDIPITVDSLKSLPQIEKDVTFQTAKGPSTAHYKGVLLWDLLKANKAFEGLQRNGELRKTIMVSAEDGYQIAFSVGEIAPDFGDLPLMLVTDVDGKPLADGLRLVAPGDKRGARAIQQIVTIDLR